MKTLLYFCVVQTKYEVIHVLVWPQDVLAACAGPHSSAKAERKGVGMIWVLLFNVFTWQLEVGMECALKYLSFELASCFLCCCHHLLSI